MSTRHVYEIIGMTCDHCAAAIKNALERLPGVSADVSFEERKAFIDAPESLDSGVLVGAIRKAGYGIADGGEEHGFAVIVGSGSAAFAAAIGLASSGKNVTMIER
ncbi:Heavy metal transport/detoxification protein domain protein, partial [mine drainage metagenome]